MTIKQTAKRAKLFSFLGYFFFIVCLPFLTSCEGKKTIVNGLEERDANEILVFLASKGISAGKVEAKSTGGGGGKGPQFWDIEVNSSEAVEAMRLLNQQGLPRRRTQNLLGIFSTSGLVPSDLQEKIKYRAALAEQLAGVIRKNEGILDADVQVSFPEEDPLNPGKMKGKITASVWVTHSGILDDPNSHLVARIKRYIASSVTGLDPDDVTVIPVRARLGELPGSLDEGARDQEKQYVNVWGITIAKDSLFSFRIIFFSFSLATLFLLLALIWMLWKTYPLIAKHGGIRSLFSIAPLKDTAPSIERSPVAPVKPLKKEPPKTEKTVDKGVDET